MPVPSPHCPSPHQTPIHTDTHIHTHNPQETSRLYLSQKPSVAGLVIVLPTKQFSTCLWSCFWITSGSPSLWTPPNPYPLGKESAGSSSHLAQSQHGEIPAYSHSQGFLFNQRTAVTSWAPHPSASRHESTSVWTVAPSQAVGDTAAGDWG